MPLYEYECAKCGTRFEKIESVHAPQRRKCPKCRGRAERLQSAPAIQFKGSGWYVTDYAGKGAKPEAKETGEAKEAKEGKEVKEVKESKEKKEVTPAKEPTKKHHK